MQRWYEVSACGPRQLRRKGARGSHSNLTSGGIGDRMQSARSVPVPANFPVRQTKKAGAWPASADCSSVVSRLTLVRRAVPRFEAHWAFEIYVRRRRFELRLACACRAQLAVHAADSLPGLVAVVPGLLSV